MDPFVVEVQAVIESKQLFDRGHRLLVAVSGGLDSMVLAEVLHQLGYHVHVAHVNYQLRGSQSDQDMEHVKRWALTRGAKFSGTRPVLEQVRQSGESTQMVARRLRYQFFSDLLDTHQLDYIITAHHLDDSMETILMNLIRGTGLKGLLGTPIINDRIRRPLARQPRQGILNYAQRINLKWREDASNARDDYQRNRIRHHVIPTLRDYGLTDKAIRATIENLSATAELAQHTRDSLTVTDKATATTTFNVASLSPRAIVDLIHPSCRAAGFTVEQMRQIAARAASLTVRVVGFELIRAGRKIMLKRASNISEPLPDITIRDLPAIFHSGGNTYRVALLPKPKRFDTEGTQYLSVAPVCIAPHGLTLHLRPRQNGDRIAPLGMGGKTKKIQDIFIDRKTPRQDRDRHYLLQDDQGNILAIPGIIQSELTRVQDTDEEVISLQRLPLDRSAD